MAGHRHENRPLSKCVDRLPIDGVYVNLCFSREQTAREERGWQVSRLFGIR